MLESGDVKTVLGMLALFYLISVGIALITYFKPPANINPLYGYRSGRAMKNQENWDFAQRAFPRYLLVVGHAQTGLSLLILLFLRNFMSLDAQMLIHVVLFCLSFLIVIPLVEHKLKRFENEKQA